MNKEKVLRKKYVTPKESLREELLNLLEQNSFCQPLPNDFPTKWEKHGDLILLSSSCLSDPVWINFGDEVWNVVMKVLKCERIARKYKIKSDDFRSPQVELLKGKDSWVTHVDNRIKYTFDITKCMFSSGNISEKLRIAELSCKGETVVDLYAGIGYFTLPFIIHAKASLVHACEWNSHAVEALERNVTLNNVREKCVIHFGDNRAVCPEKVADRVNLGLIPSSENGWETACRALRPSTGGLLHIHGNVTNRSATNAGTSPTDERRRWAENVSCSLRSIFLNMYGTRWSVQVLKVIRIKSYAPHIEHVVADVKCVPS